MSATKREQLKELRQQLEEMRKRLSATVSGLNYEVTYPGVTDKYGMYSAVFGETAPEGRYSVRVVGPGGTATGVFEILSGRAG